MGQENNTPEQGKKGSHFKQEQRLILEYLWNGRGTFARERNKTKLAKIFGKDRRTIERELKRGSVELLDSELRPYKTYSEVFAQRDADEKKSEQGTPEKIGNDHALCKAISEKTIKEKQSPYAIVSDFENNNRWPTQTRLCEKTIYRYIYKGFIPGVTKDNLLYQGKRHKPAGKPRKHARAGCAARSIENRPQEVNERKVAGHWEMDTVRSAKGTHTDCLLTLTERLTRAEIIRKLPNGTGEAVVDAINQIELLLGSKLFKSIFKSVTPDNGTEFMDFEGLEISPVTKQKRFDLFYAHPYRASERGTNENANGMIRRFFPKGTDFSTVTDSEISYVQHWMNSYPRRILNSSCSKNMFSSSFGSEFLLTG